MSDVLSGEGGVAKSDVLGGEGGVAKSDVLLLSLGTTIGLRASDATLASLMRDAGASVEVVTVRVGATGALRRAYPVTDLVEALAARRALRAALARTRPRAVVFSTTTASLLAPRLEVPYAIRLDGPARLNRPGARNGLQHALERRRMAGARLILPNSDAAANALPEGAAPAVVVPESVLPSSGGQEQKPSDGGQERERLAVAYTPDPKAKGLDIVVAAWQRAALPDARLEVFGISDELAQRHLARNGLSAPPGLALRGRVGEREFRAALRRARVFLSGARWEDLGRAQLEALADGALLVCGASGGAFEALSHARELAPELCAPDLRAESLATALRSAFALEEERVERYRALAAERMRAYRPEAARAIIAERVLPALLS
ncbi:MAG: glycosyltransferase [Solirubrobacteraceae bacterium]